VERFAVLNPNLVEEERQGWRTWRRSTRISLTMWGHQLHRQRLRRSSMIIDLDNDSSSFNTDED
jgi:hypothetical protein